MLPKEGIREFKKLYKKKFNKDIDDQEASRMGTKLINLYKAIYKPNKRYDK